eukprot:7371976-Pyramimonas_sp.AAC.1
MRGEGIYCAALTERPTSACPPGKLAHPALGGPIGSNVSQGCESRYPVRVYGHTWSALGCHSECFVMVRDVESGVIVLSLLEGMLVRREVRMGFS